MTEGYTRGPWVAVHNENYWEIRSDHHGQIGDACASNFIYIGGELLPKSETEIIAAANARLIAASPDLLEALRQCQRVLHDLTRGDKSLSSLHIFTHAIEAEAKARAAIARAEGGEVAP